MMVTRDRKSSPSFPKEVYPKKPYPENEDKIFNFLMKSLDSPFTSHLLQASPNKYTLKKLIQEMNMQFLIF